MTRKQICLKNFLSMHNKSFIFFFVAIQVMFWSKGNGPLAKLGVVYAGSGLQIVAAEGKITQK